MGDPRELEWAKKPDALKESWTARIGTHVYTEFPLQVMSSFEIRLQVGMKNLMKLNRWSMGVAEEEETISCVLETAVQDMVVMRWNKALNFTSLVQAFSNQQFHLSTAIP